MSKTRGDIEAFGIDAVSSVIRKGQHLSPQLNKNEKTPSYDGYVSIINNQTGNYIFFQLLPLRPAASDWESYNGDIEDNGDNEDIEDIEVLQQHPEIRFRIF